MTYIVNDKCIKCKLMDCVEVCPVDCFYEGKNMLVIKPDECIDCGVCEPECPVDAIKADTEEGSEKWLELNKKYSEIWPNIILNLKNKNISLILLNARITKKSYKKWKKISFFSLMFGQISEYFVFNSSHLSLPCSVSETIASTGHSGSQTPQSIHSSGLITSIFFPS